MSLLLATQTQWHMLSLATLSSASVVRTGLNYAAIEPAARMAGIDVTPDVFSRLRILESEALVAWSQERQARA